LDHAIFLVLGYPFGCGIDIWSAGCSIFELYTGKVLFPGRSNNHMLKLMLDLKGKMHSKLIRHSSFGSEYFNIERNGEFLYDESDCASIKVLMVFYELYLIGFQGLKRPIVYSNPVRNLKSIILDQSMSAKEKHVASLLADLIDKCIELNPERRLSARTALAHPFLCHDFSI